MAKTKEKQINVHYIGTLVELYNELAERGEILDSINFIDEDFKFSGGHLFLFARLTKIKNFDTTAKDEDKTIKRRYISNSEYPIGVKDFKVKKEETFYK